MKRVVAWYNRSEWTCVYNDLFSTDPVLQRHGVDRVTVWKCRVLHKLSTAIECTTELVRAQLLDKQYVDDSTKEQEIRLTLAMAVIRFVNLITEKAQTEDYAQSVHNVAQQVGLPEWLVDLRHDATHSSLPSIYILRRALKSALDWIKINYWEAQLLADEDETPLMQQNNSKVKPNPLNTEVATVKAEKLISDYINCQLKIVSQKGGDSPKPEGNPSRVILDEMEKLINTNREEVVKVIIQDGCLIPTTNHLTILNVDIKDFLCSNKLVLPKELLTIWRPLLKMFHQKNLTEGLLQALCMTLTENCDLRNKLICGWIETVVHHALDPEKYKKNDRLYKRGCDLNSKGLMEMLVQKPSKQTKKLLSSIFHVTDCGLTKSQQRRLLDCIHKYTAEPNGEMEEDSEIHTLEEITGQPSSFSEQVPLTTAIATSSTSAWTLCTDIIDWSKYPLGTCPGVSVDYTNLELPTGNQANIEDINSTHCDNSDATMDYIANDDFIQDSEEHINHGRNQWSEQKIQTIASSIQLF